MTYFSLDKMMNPYSYEEFTMWESGRLIPANGALYSDRLYQWNSTKHNDLCMKHFGNVGQYWNGRDPDLIQAFLRDYLDDPKLQLLEIKEGCNRASGYPYWCFLYMSPKAAG